MTTYAAVLVECVSLVRWGIDQTRMQSEGAGETASAPVSFKSDALRHFGSSHVMKGGGLQRDGQHYADAASVVPH